VSVGGIQATIPTVAQVVTQETLPFTGLSTPGMAALAVALAAAGGILLAASRQTEERNPVRSWN
jgi:hypothetical protein